MRRWRDRHRGYSLPRNQRIMIASGIEETIMARRSDEGDWRRHVVENMLPRMDANTGPAATSFQAAQDFGPVVFRGDRSPDDAAALLPDAAATKFIAIGQIASDLHGAIPKHEQMQELRLEITGLKNRLADLNRPLSEGGSAVPATAWQVADVERKLDRGEKELRRLAELVEVRGSRWTSAAQLHQAVSDWVLRGIPANCVIEVVEDAPIAELMKKGETIANAVERFRHRQRECAADRHRVNSSPWPSSVVKAAAKEFIDRLADQGAPDLDAAIEHGMPISFATTRLTTKIFNVDAPGAIGFADADAAIATMCWLWRDQMFSKICAGLDEISDDKNALDQGQRETMLATIDADSLLAERCEVACIYASQRGEAIAFRATTTPAAAIGVQLRTVPRAAPSGTSPEHGYNIIGVRR